MVGADSNCPIDHHDAESGCTGVALPRTDRCKRTVEEELASLALGYCGCHHCGRSRADVARRQLAVVRLECMVVGKKVPEAEA